MDDKFYFLKPRKSFKFDFRDKQKKLSPKILFHAE